MKLNLILRDTCGGGYRTWRLALAFFGGLGIALQILDYLAVTRSRYGGGSGQSLAFSLLVWPLAHLLVVTGLAYAPYLLRLCKQFAPNVCGRQFYLGLAVACSLVYAAAVSISLLGTGALAGWEMHDPRVQLQEAVDQISVGALVPDARGVVSLPAEMHGTTVDGSAYVTVTDSGKRWILFRTWRGKAANLRGYLYTSGDAIAVPADVSITTETAAVIGPADVTVESNLGNSWYRVSRSLD